MDRFIVFAQITMKKDKPVFTWEGLFNLDYEQKTFVNKIENQLYNQNRSKPLNMAMCYWSHEEDFCGLAGDVQTSFEDFKRDNLDIYNGNVDTSPIEQTEEDEMIKINSWSQTYYKGLNAHQHSVNNRWMKSTTGMLKEGGTILVPNLGKSFKLVGEYVVEVV